jgi:hypothetical protein
MAHLLDYNTLNSKVENLIDTDTDINTKQKAFPILMVGSMMGISDEESEDSITDGPKDRGIDAIYIDDNNNTTHLFQFKYVNTYENSKKNFPSSEIDKVTSFVDDLLDKDINLEQSCNPLLWNKVKDIWATLEKPKSTIVIHFCGNTEYMTDEEKERVLKKVNKYRSVLIDHHSLDSIIQFFVEKDTIKIDHNLRIVDKDYFDRTDGNIRGLICSIEVSELIKMIKSNDDPTQVNFDIFNDNVRIYLTRSNKINKKIIESALSDDNNLFWYKNNGITITCDSFSYPRARGPIVELKNIQIVNGGQTSNALFEAYQLDSEKLEDVLILARIIETKSQDVSLSIAESTNSQTPIKTRDLRSNDEIQKKIEAAFLAKGFYYERKLKQFQGQPRNKRIDALLSGQSYLAYGLELPEVAKKDRGRIFSDLYETVFNEDLTTAQLLTSFRLLQQVELYKKDVQSRIRKSIHVNKNELYIVDGAYHVLFAVGQIAEKNQIDRYNFGEAKDLISEAKDLVQKVVKENQGTDETFSFNRFFKDARTKTKIVTELYK